MEQLPQRIFVAGIGTGVGKTLVSAGLVEALRADYWKPVQCGNLGKSDTQVIQSLITNPDSKLYLETYRLKMAASPHYAAQLEDIEIDIKKCLLPTAVGPLVIEAAGGLMVPLNKESLVVDLVKIFDASVILVVRNYLGSINHTLLSIEALKQRGINMMGIIFSGQNFLDNEEIIQHFGNIPVLGRIDEANEIDRAFIMHQAEKIKAALAQRYKL